MMYPRLKEYPVIVSDALWEYLKLVRVLGEDIPKTVSPIFIIQYLTCHDYLMKGENNIQIYMNNDLADILKVPVGNIGFTHLIKALDMHQTVTLDQDLHLSLSSLEQFFKEIKSYRPKPITEEQLTLLKERWNAMGLRKV